MQVIDLNEAHERAYFMCLEEWSDEMQEAGDHKAHWYREMRERGLRVKLALDDDGALAGMIQYVPIEHSVAEGRDLYFVCCIWVHGHKGGVGNRQKRGMGTALLRAAEDDARALGAKGMAAWGLAIPVWMKASWFKKHGYEKAARMGIQLLVWKRFADDARAPSWRRQHAEPETRPGKVTVTGCLSGWCPAMNISFERARRAAAAFGDEVVFEHVETRDPEVLADWGTASDALFIDGKSVRTGPPPSGKKLRKLIRKRVRKLD